MKSNWLTALERQYIQTLMTEAIELVKLRDMKQCTVFVQDAVRARPLAKTMLRTEVRTTIATDGVRILRRMLTRHAGYKKLSCPLRGMALARQAGKLGLVQRTETVRVDAHTLREECYLAEVRLKMKMREEIGKQCKTVLMLKKKRKQCVHGIKAQAITTGVADITRVRRD
jgi:hypothetical protein